MLLHVVIMFICVAAKVGRHAADVALDFLWTMVFGWKIGMHFSRMQKKLLGKHPRLLSSAEFWRSPAEMRRSPWLCQTRRLQGCWTSPSCASTPRQRPTWPRAAQFGRCVGGGEWSWSFGMHCPCFRLRFGQVPTSRTSMYHTARLFGSRPCWRLRIAVEVWTVWRFRFSFGWPWALTRRTGSSWRISSNRSLGGQAATWGWGSCFFLQRSGMADFTAGFLWTECAMLWGQAGTWSTSGTDFVEKLDQPVMQVCWTWPFSVASSTVRVLSQLLGSNWLGTAWMSTSKHVAESICPSSFLGLVIPLCWAQPLSANPLHVPQLSLHWEGLSSLRNSRKELRSIRCWPRSSVQEVSQWPWCVTSCLFPWKLQRSWTS